MRSRTTAIGRQGILVEGVVQWTLHGGTCVHILTRRACYMMWVWQASLYTEITEKYHFKVWVVNIHTQLLPALPPSAQPLSDRRRSGTAASCRVPRGCCHHISGNALTAAFRRGAAMPFAPVPGSRCCRGGPGSGEGRSRAPASPGLHWLRGRRDRKSVV